MCSRYTYNKDETKLKLRGQILVFGFVPHGDIRPTDLGPVITTTQPNATVAPYHNRMPLIIHPKFYDDWLGDNWQKVLTEPDHAPPEKYQKQPELFESK